MAYAMEKGRVYQAEIFGADLKTGQAFDTVLHYRFEPSGGAPTYGNIIAGSSSTTFLQNLLSAWTTLISVSVSDHYVVGSIFLKQILGWHFLPPVFTFDAIDLITADPAVNHGGAAGQAVPDMATYSLRKHTNVPGRSGRGRLALGPVPEASQSNGAITTVELAILQALADAFLTPIACTGGADALSLQVCSKTLAVSQGATPTATESLTWCFPVTQLRLNLNLGSQLSRKNPQSSMIIQ